MPDRVTVRMDPESMAAFERCFACPPDGCRTKQDLLRIIVREWLTDRGYLTCDKPGSTTSD